MKGMKKSLVKRTPFPRRTSVRWETPLYPIIRLADVPKTWRQEDVPSQHYPFKYLSVALTRRSDRARLHEFRNV